MGACYTWCSKLLSMPATYVLFLVGAFMHGTGQHFLSPTKTNWLSRAILFSVIYIIVGGIFFFQKPPVMYGSPSTRCQPTVCPTPTWAERNRPFLANSHLLGDLQVHESRFLLSHRVAASCWHSSDKESTVARRSRHQVERCHQTDKARSGNNVCVTKIQNPVRPLQGEYAVLFQSTIVLQPWRVAGFHGELG